MRNATASDILGWSPRDVSVIDERLGQVQAWLSHNGDVERAVDAVGRRVRSLSRGQADAWRKATRQALQEQMARALRRSHPRLAAIPGCGDAVEAMADGSVLDLDGFWVEGFEGIDLSRAPAEVLPDLAKAIRREFSEEPAA